jgi:hypothetical protein
MDAGKNMKAITNQFATILKGGINRLIKIFNQSIN